MMISVMVLVPINAYLCYKGKSLESDLQSTRTQIALIQADNHNLANQLENAQIQAAAYQKQVDDLNQKVLAKMQQAEKRNNEIIHTLEKQSNRIGYFARKQRFAKYRAWKLKPMRI